MPLREPLAGLGGLVALVGTHPSSSEANSVGAILAALARSETVAQLDTAILDVLAPSTMLDLAALINGMLDNQISDQVLRAAAKRVLVRRVK